MTQGIPENTTTQSGGAGLLHYSVMYPRGGLSEEEWSPVSPSPTDIDNIAIREIANVMLLRYYFDNDIDDGITVNMVGFGLFLQSRDEWYVRGAHTMEITPPDENIRYETYAICRIPNSEQIEEWLWQWSVYESSFNPQFVCHAKMWMAIARITENDSFNVLLYRLSDEKRNELVTPEVYRRPKDPETFWLIDYTE